MSTTLLNLIQSAGNGIFYPAALETRILEAEKALRITFPADLREFYLTTNGFEGEIGEFLFFLSPVEQLADNTERYCREFNPWAIVLGTNGSLEMLVIDTRSNPLLFGLMPNIGDEEDFIPLAYSFERFLARLVDGTAFERRPLD
jgi:hypothetical protein